MYRSVLLRAQALDLRGGTLARGFVGCELTHEPAMHVFESEQAKLYCNLALSVLLKYRYGGCKGMYCCLADGDATHTTTHQELLV